MKRTSLVLLACLSAAGVYAQNQGSALDGVMEETVKKEKEKSDKSVTDEKTAAKASFWMDRAKTYQQIATTPQFIKLDSNASTVAYDAYKKVVELDKTKKGDAGRLAKEAQEAMKSQTMYAAFMSTGASKYQGKNFTSALKDMQMASEIMPKDTTAALYTGIAAQQAQNNNLAKEAFERYAANGGKDPSVYYSLASLYRNDKEIDKAIATLDRGLQALPGNKDLSAERINVMMASGRMDDAIAGMKKLVESDPQNVQNVLNLAILYDNNASRMTQDIQKLSEEAKRGGDAKKKLASEKDALDAMNGEVVRLTNRVKREPKNADLKRQLTDVMKRQTETKANIAKLEAQVKEEEAKGSANDAQQRLTEMTRKQTEQKDAAKEYYTKALAVDPNNYDANYNMGVFFFNDAVEMKKAVDNMSMAEYQKSGKEVEGRVCGKFKQALPYFQKAKAVKDSDEDLNSNLASLENILKQFEGKGIVCVQ